MRRHHVRRQPVFTKKAGDIVYSSVPKLRYGVDGMLSQGLNIVKAAAPY